MSKISTIIIASIFPLLLSCSSNNTEDSYATGENANIQVYDAPDLKQEKITANEEASLKNNNKASKIIKDASLTVKTADIQASKKNLNELIKRFNGYYEKEDLINDDYTTSYNLKIRVPSKDFENFITTIESGKEEIKNKSIQARDVTEEFIDIESRLNNKKEYLSRYKVLLGKANSIKDILDIQENIRTIEEEIESTAGRLKYLNDQITYSNIDLNLFKEKDYTFKRTSKGSFFERLKSSLSNGWIAIGDFMLWLISIWPFLIIIVSVIWLTRKYLKKRKTSNNN